MDAINASVIEGERCAVRERATAEALEGWKKRAQLPDETPWWVKPETVVGGIVVGFGLGALVAAAVLRR